MWEGIMEDVIVAKFGGSSLANSTQFLKVKNIIQSNPQRKCIVVSAPGKSSKEDHKITDLLYMCHQLASFRLSFDDVFLLVETKYISICQDLKLTVDIVDELKNIKSMILNGASVDFVASRGEYLSALLLANYCGYEFVDAQEIIVFDEHRKVDLKKSSIKINERLTQSTAVVIPGFYGANSTNEIITFTRGGSDISGAILANSLSCSMYENWTDVSGFLIADPSIVNNPLPIKMITYKELRELSYMGAPVLHQETLFPIKNKGIVVSIKNTNYPDHEGTKIVDDFYQFEQSDIITGIAGKKDFTVISIEKTRMSEQQDFLRKVITVMETNNISVEHMPTSIDSISLVVSTVQLNSKLDKIMEEIKIYCHPDSIIAYPNMALIAVVGRKMIRTKGISSKIFTALANSGINIRMITQGSSELNVIIGVETIDFEASISAIYYAFEKDIAKEPS